MQAPRRPRSPAASCRLAASCWALLAGTGSALAAEIAAEMAADALPAAVSSVASGGYWQQEGRAGLVRAVVWTRGYESLTSSLAVEWWAEAAAPDQAATWVAAVRPEDPLGSPGVFEVAVRRVRPGCTAVVLSGQTPASPKPVRRQWWATTPGTLLPAQTPQGRWLPSPPACAGPQRAAAPTTGRPAR